MANDPIAGIGKRKTWTVEGLPAAPRAVLPQNQLPAPAEAALDKLMRPGSLVVAEGDGRRYRISGHLGTLERDTPKLRGKAARRSEKRARRLAREQKAPS